MRNAFLLPLPSFIFIEMSPGVSASAQENSPCKAVTPRSGDQTYIWDMTDSEGKKVDAGDYFVMVESTLSGKNSVIFRCGIPEGRHEMNFCEPFYNTGDQINRNMLKSVTTRLVSSTE